MTDARWPCGSIAIFPARRKNATAPCKFRQDNKPTKEHDMSLDERVRINKVEMLSESWGKLRRNTFDYLRSDGSWQQQQRETYDRGNGATMLLYNVERRTVVLIRQFRFPAYANGYRELLIETPAGLLDRAGPEQRIRSEVEEETGFRVRDIRKVFEAYMSPGSVTEKLHFFAASYEASDRVTDGGGEAHEGEDIEVIEMDFAAALAATRDGRIVDGKTIMLLQYAALEIFGSD